MYKNKSLIERILDAQLHLKMAREGPVEKCEKRIKKAEKELQPFSKNV